MMEKDVSIKNTKNEILQAYDELLKKVQEQKKQDAKGTSVQEKRDETVKKASGLSNEAIVKDIAGLKISLNASLEKLEDSLLEEYRKFSEVKEALDIEARRLEEVYQISVNVDSLAALLLAQKEKKEEFEHEMHEKKTLFEQEMKTARDSWQSEKQKFEESLKEQKAEKEKQRKREEEEYSYNLSVQRKKEENAYQERKIMLEKEIDNKEKEWQEKEAEFLRLQSEVEKFPKELDNAVKQAKDDITKELISKHKYEVDLSKKETDGEMKLMKQTIQTLESKIKEQAVLIDQLTKKSDHASDQVKDIAVKAIEGASNRSKSNWETEKKENIERG